MSLLRSPSKHAPSGGSHPDLTKLSGVETDSSITFRKRKLPFDHDCTCTNEIQEIRSQLYHMNQLLEKYAGSNEKLLNKMQESISEVKTQIEEIKTSNEKTNNLFRESITDIKIQMNELKSTSSNILLEHNNIKSKVTLLENKISTNENKIKSLESIPPKYELTTSTNINAVLSSNECLIREIRDRQEREKNIIIMGIPEQNCQSTEERIYKDEIEVMAVTQSIYKDIQKPLKIIRLGKYNPTKNRRIKVCYDSKEPAKQLLRGKIKVPGNIKIYSDQTPAQIKYLQSLKEELLRRTSNGENDLTIKYINGTPTITKNITKN